MFNFRKRQDERDEVIAGWLSYLGDQAHGFHTDTMQSLSTLSAKVDDLAKSAQEVKPVVPDTTTVQINDIIVLNQVACNKLLLSLSENVTEVRHALDQIFLMYQLPHGEPLISVETDDDGGGETDEPPPIPEKPHGKKGKTK